MRNYFLSLVVSGVAFLGVAGVSVGSNLNPNPDPSAPREVKRARRAERMKARIEAEGGIVTKENHGSYFRVLSAQKTVGLDFIQSVVAQFNTGLNVWVEVGEIDPESSPLALAKKAMGLPKTGLALVIVDDAETPVILSAMEDGWAVLNIRRLKSDMPPKATYEMRVRKEINRAFAQAAGAGLSLNKPCVMEPAYTLSQLDRIQFPVISPEAMGKIMDACGKRGVPPIVTGTYEEACREGWAPAPVGDVQKSIWHKAHSLPSKPMKIEFDPSRDAGK